MNTSTVTTVSTDVTAAWGVKKKEKARSTESPPSHHCIVGPAHLCVNTPHPAGKSEVLKRLDTVKVVTTKIPPSGPTHSSYDLLAAPGKPESLGCGSLPSMEGNHSVWSLRLHSTRHRNLVDAGRIDRLMVLS